LIITPILVNSVGADMSKLQNSVDREILSILKDIPNGPTVDDTVPELNDHSKDNDLNQNIMNNSNPQIGSTGSENNDALQPGKINKDAVEPAGGIPEPRKNKSGYPDTRAIQTSKNDPDTVYPSSAKMSNIIGNPPNIITSSLISQCIDEPKILSYNEAKAAALPDSSNEDDSFPGMPLRLYTDPEDYGTPLETDKNIQYVMKAYLDSIAKFNRGMPEDIQPVHVLAVRDKVIFSDGGMARITNITDNMEIWVRNLTEANGRAKGEEYKYTGKIEDMRLAWNIKNHRKITTRIVVSSESPVLSKFGVGDIVSSLASPEIGRGIIVGVRVGSQQADIKWQNNDRGYCVDFNSLHKIGSIFNTSSVIDDSEPSIVDVRSNGSYYVYNPENNNIEEKKAALLDITLNGMSAETYNSVDRLLTEVYNTLDTVSNNNEYNTKPQTVLKTKHGSIKIYVSNVNSQKVKCDIPEQLIKEGIDKQVLDGYTILSSMTYGTDANKRVILEALEV